MLMIGNAVTHSMFPQWGKGIIAEIIIDINTGIANATVMWESLNGGTLGLYAMNHLVPFIDCPKVN